MNSRPCWPPLLIGEIPANRAALDRLLDGSVTGARIHHARIALLDLTHGVDELWSVDRDFSRFPWITTTNPLAA